MAAAVFSMAILRLSMPAWIVLRCSAPSRPRIVLISLMAAEELREAFAAYEHALTIEPKTPADLAAQDDSLYQLAALDLKMGAHERALKWLEELITVSPEHSEAHYAYAQALMRMGREDEAERELGIHTELMSRRQPTGQVATGD